MKEHEQANRLLATLVACEVIMRMLLGRIFREHMYTCGGPSYLDMRAPEWHSGENNNNNNNLILILRAFHEMIKRALHDFYL